MCLSNWAHHWGETLGYDHCSLDYRGPQPWSEVEVTNVRDWVLERNDNIKFFQTLHSFGQVQLDHFASLCPQLIMTPWGYSDEIPPNYDAMYDLALRGNEALFATHGTVYQVTRTVFVPCTRPGDRLAV